MKSRHNRFLTPFLTGVLATSIVAAVSVANAATFTWDASGGDPLNDGAGTWAATGGTNWYNNTTTLYGGWGNTTADEAVFGAGSGPAGTVTVSGSVNVNKITFAATGSGNYGIAVFPGGNIALGGVTPTIAANVAASIGAPLTGSAGMIKNGPGVLTLSAKNTYTGTTTVNGGTLALGYNSGGDGTLQGSLTVNPGAVVALKAGNVLGYSGNNWVRTINLNEGTLRTDVSATDNCWGTTINMFKGTLSSSVAGGRFSMGSASLFNVTGANAESAISADLTVRDTITFDVSRGSTASDLTVSGNLLEAGANKGIAKRGSGILTLSGSNTFVGGNAASTVNAGTLRLDYSTNNNSKLADNGALIFGGRPVTLELAGGSHPEVVSGTTLNANSAATITRSSGSAIIHLGAITRNAGATLSLAEAGIATTSTLNNAGGIIGTWAMIGNDWAVNSTNAANGPITAFTAYTDYTRLSSGTKVIPDGATSNIRIIEGTGTAGDLSLGAATTFVNSMKLTATGGTTVIDMGTNTLRLGVSGGILTDAGGAALAIGTTAGQGTLSAGGNVANTAGEVFLNQLGGSPVTIHSSIVNNGTGAVSLLKIGSGDLTLTGANLYTGSTFIGQGTTTYVEGSSFNPSAVANLRVGGADGKAVLNLASSGIFKFGHTRVGGDDGSSDTGKGAINQTAGTVSVSSSYLGLGVGTGPGGALTDTYGSYVLSGPSSVLNHAGIRVGDGGLGVFTQTGGTHTSSNHFVIGASEGSDSAGTGVATFTGGTATIASGGRFILADRQLSTGTLNIGTLAGANAVVENGGTQEVTMLGNSNARGATVNLNGGTLTVGGPLKRNTGNNNAANTSTVNFNGGTLKVKGGTSLIDANPLMMVNVFNGGLKVDTQANTTTIGATLVAATGNGIYPAGGTLNLPAPGGAGYIGAPLVTVTTSGAGTGAGAIATVVNGQVTGVTLTCPGQGYLAGDTVSFAFAGGGFGTAASTFAYNLQAADLAANGSGGLTKQGSGKLTISGTDVFGGLLSVEGKLAAGNLSLGSGGVKIVNFIPSLSSAPLEATTALATTAATVPVEITGTFTLGSWPVIYYPSGGSVGGNGAAAFQLNTGALPRGVVASLVDYPGTASVNLDVTAFNPLTWKGTTNGNWNINATTNWTIGAAPEKYQEGDIVLFDDSVGAGPTSVVLNTSVSPSSVAFENDTVNYTLSGTGAISGSCGLTKANNGTLLIRNANTYTGTTTVNGGVLQLGDGTLNGSVAGPLVNNATVVFNPAGTSAAYAGAISGTGTYQKTGSGTQVFVGATNTATGSFLIDEGTYQLGNGVVTGVSGASCQYQIASGATMRLERPTAVGPFWNNISGAGTLALNSAQPVNGSAFWGELALPATFTGTLRVEKGRVDAPADGNTSLGGTSKIQILSGAQFLAFESVNPYAAPIEIAGNGFGEAGQPGALRLAADRTATWSGDVTLTADSGIRVQRNAFFMITGSITGSHRCDFVLGESGGAPATLNINPTAPTQNSYGSTRIDGQPNGAVVAGNERAFSSGALEMANAILKLNGYSFNFASLSGTGGQIGNFSASTPSVLTVGDASDTAYAGVLTNGDAASLSLVKTGAGKLTLSGISTYSGNTTVNAGTLELAETGRLRFAIGASSGVSNKITGSGNALLDGDFVIDTTAASALTAGSWTIENVSSLTGAYGSTFQVLNPDGSPWTDAGGDKWTRTVGSKIWTFDETNGTLTLAVSGYNSWADSWLGLTDKTPGGDPDGDGISNLMEYVIGGDPRVSSTEFLPKQTIVGPDLVISYKRSDDSEGDTTQTGQWSATLGSWADIPPVLVNENGSSPDDMTVTIPLTNAVNGKLFGRIKVTQP